MDLEQLSKEEVIAFLREKEAAWEEECRMLQKKIVVLERECWGLRGANRRMRKDCLTGVSTRRELEGHLDMFRCVARRDPGTFWGLLVWLDLDDFKQFNDVRGHPEGDKLLQFFAKELTTCFHPCIVHRHGGDEFVLTYVAESKEEAEEMAQAIEDGLRNGIPYEDTIIRVSVGTKCVPLDHTLNIKKLIKEADDLMYLKKAASKERAEGKSNA